MQLEKLFKDKCLLEGLKFTYGTHKKIANGLTKLLANIYHTILLHLFWLCI